MLKRIGAVLFFALLGGAIISSEVFASVATTVIGVFIVVVLCAGGLVFDAASYWKRKN